MKNVLIVEPDLAFGMSCVRACVVAGFQAAQATSPAKALASINQSRPDLVLMSLRARDNRSIQLLQEIRSNSRTRTLPVIAFAREDVGSLLAEARSKGADECLVLQGTKTEELVSALNRILPSTTTPAPPTRRPDSAVQPPTPSVPSVPEPPVKLADVPRESPRPVAAPAPAPRPQSFSRKTDSLENLKEISRSLFGCHDLSAQQPLLAELLRLAQSLAATASAEDSRFASSLLEALAALLRELAENPRSIGTSNTRTILQALHCVESLQQNAPPSSEQAETPFRILAVDDDPGICNIVKLSLSSAGLSPDSANNAAEALELAKRNRYELFILDVNMPGLTGFELCQKLRAQRTYRETPVIFVTGADNFESRVRSAGSGGDDFIGKPFLMKELAVKALIHLLPHRLGLRSR